MQQPFRVVRSRRRTMAITITRQAEVIIRAPFHTGNSAIAAFAAAHRDWIKAHLSRQQDWLRRHPEPSEEACRALRARAEAELPGRVAHYAALMSLQPTGIRITGAKTRFGSCSASNHLCFSFRLMEYEDAAIDYVVVHELAHILHKDHGPDFYRAIEAILPDYRERIRLLRDR